MLTKLLFFASLISIIYAINTLDKDQCLTQCDVLYSSNFCFKLVMQDDGNLVVYRISDNKAFWSSRTSRSCSERVCMQGDGNFVLYDCQDKATWASNTQNNPGSTIILQDNGNLVIHKAVTNQVLWSSGTVANCA